MEGVAVRIAARFFVYLAVPDVQRFCIDESISRID